MRPMILLALAAALGCSSGPSHHFRIINARRSPRAEPCAVPPLHTDHGPSTAREAIAVVTAECSDAHPEQCRAALQRATCEANADAVVDVEARPLRGGRVRMVGTAVEWQAP
jgi:hypothetical protein